MGELKEAARFSVDPIEHNKGILGAVVGGLIGFAVGVVVVLALASNPVGWVAAAALIGTALSVGGATMAVGEYVGGKIGKAINFDAGDILRGSPNVTIGNVALWAARATDDVKCHAGKKIAEGCKKISINRLPAARKGHRTECDGKIKEGCATVKLGGPTVVVLAVVEEDLPWLYKVFKEVVDWGGTILGIPALLKKGVFTALKEAWKLKGWAKAYKTADALYEVADLATFAPKKYFEGKLGNEQWAFTKSEGYKRFDTVWSGVGVARGARDAVSAVRAPKPQGSLLVADPGAPPGWSAKGEGTIVTRDLPPGHTTSPGGVIHPDGQIHIENQVQFNGQKFNRSEGGLFLPEGVKGNAKVPNVAPRPSGPVGESSLILLPGAAPRPQLKLVGSNATVPGPAPRVTAQPTPEVPRNVESPPPVPASKPSPPTAEQLAEWQNDKINKPLDAGGKGAKWLISTFDEPSYGATKATPGQTY